MNIRKFTRPIARGGPLLLAVGLLALLCLPLTPTSVNAQPVPEVSIQDVTLEAGESVTVPIELTDFTDLCGLTVNLAWSDSLVSVTNVTDGDLGLVTIGDYSASPVTLAWASATGYTGDFDFVYVTLQALARVTGPWSCTLDLTVVSCLDSGTLPITHTVDDGILTVLKPSEVWVDADWDTASPGDPAGGHVFGYNAFATIQDGIDGVRGSTVHVAVGTYAGFNFTGRDGLEILGEAGAVVNSACAADAGTLAYVDNSTNTLIDGLEFNGSSLNVTSEYGIRFLNGSTGIISNVNVHHLRAGTTGTGIHINTNTTTVNISGAQIANCDIGIIAVSGRVNIDGCTISNCTTNAGYGVRVESGADVEISGCCKIHHNIKGIRVDSSGTLTANGNSIYSNSGFGIQNGSASTADAEDNWWGDAEGPNCITNPFYPTSGDAIGGDVDYVPWLDAACDAGGKSVGPNADFVGTPTSGLPGLEVAFTDLSTGTQGCDISSRDWDFGDGGTADVQDPTHTYNKAGRYTVSLTIEDELGLKDTETKTKYIKIAKPVTKGALPAPADFAASYLNVSPQQVLPNQEVEISINIANHGGQTGTHSVVLYINGHAEQSQAVSVSPGSTKLVVFKTSRAVPGGYQVSVEGQAGQFSVLKPEITTSGTPTPTAGLGTAGIVTIVVLAIILIVALVFLFRGTQRHD